MNFIALFLTTIGISLLPLLGFALLHLKPKKTNSMLSSLVALSAGTLLGGAFFHLLPESIHELGINLSLNLTLFSFICFLLIEQLLQWRHCHQTDCSTHSFGYMSLAADALHNFIDGLILASAFTTDFKLGIATSLAIILHEIPQEIGDIAVLLKADFTPKKALRFNLLIAATALLGALSGYVFATASQKLSLILLPIAAGGFIYIAATDLLPHLQHHSPIRNKFWHSFSLFLSGILLMQLLKILVH